MEHNTLAAWMEPQAVNFDVLHERYASLLGLVKSLLGVVPNCDRYLEIWPVAFRTYNIMVPNFINLPQMFFGLGAPKDLVGLALYASSRASECPYCTAHCCSFAQRRGAAPEAMSGTANPAQSAVIEAASALGAMPHSLEPAHIEALKQNLKPGHLEWIGMGIAMMGFLNKFMDALGVPLEEDSVADSHAILTQSGMKLGKHFDGALPSSVRPPQDNWQLYLSVARLAPGAIRFDKRWLGEVPKGQTDARIYLKKSTGADVPLLDRLGLERPRRALTAMLRENLDPVQSHLGLREKALASLVFAEFSCNEARQADAFDLLALHGGALDQTSRTTLAHVAAGPVPQTQAVLQDAAEALAAIGFGEREIRTIQIAHAMSSSPSALNQVTMERAMSTFTAAEMVELVTWLSIQQLMHRLDVFYDFSR